MKQGKLLRGISLSLTSLGMLLPASVIQAADTASPGQIAAVPAAMDIALGQGGTLQGQVLSPEGAPVSEANVLVWYQNANVATTKTNAKGEFAISGLHDGAHFVEVGGQVVNARLWKQGTAPPASKSNVMFVSDAKVARAQGNVTRPWLVYGVLGGIVAGGVISQNHGDGNSSSP
jgi:hypothetical protein